MRTVDYTAVKADTASKVINNLNQLLADLQVHYTNLRNLHWNIKGHGFFVLHAKYEEMYDDIAAKVDEVAERILQLGGTPEHKFSAYLSTSAISEIDVTETGDAGLDYLLSSTRTLIAAERETLSSASAGGDEVTVAMMSDYLREQEKTVWMLVAYGTVK